MARKSRKAAPTLETIWEIPDALWERLLIVLMHHFPRKKTGRPRADLRRVINGIIFRLRTGCQWARLPDDFGPKSTVHDWFCRCNKAGVFETLMAMLIDECNELKGVDWKWQAADGSMGKARLGGIKSARIPRTEPRMASNAV
jgi:putative transposase